MEQKQITINRGKHGKKYRKQIKPGHRYKNYKSCEERTRIIYVN